MKISGSYQLELVAPPLSRTTLALYAGGSHDHNPLHIDIDYARRVAGQEDVIGHGMLVMAYLARMVTNCFAQQCLQRFRVRFRASYRVGDSLLCRGSVLAERRDPNGRQIVELGLTAVRADGSLVAEGNATICLPEEMQWSG